LGGKEHQSDAFMSREKCKNKDDFTDELEEEKGGMNSDPDNKSFETCLPEKVKRVSCKRDEDEGEDQSKRRRRKSF